MADDALVVGADPDTVEVAMSAGRAACDHLGADVLVMRVGVVTTMAEYFVLVSASNRRAVRRLAEDIEADVRTGTDRSPVRVEGVKEHEWVVLDYGDVVVHVFLDQIRDFYEIERLYTDVPKRELEMTPPATAADDA